MEERYHATTQNRVYPDMSNVNKNITVEAKLISPPTYFDIGSSEDVVINFVSLPKYVMWPIFAFLLGWFPFVFSVLGWRVSVGGLGTNCFPGCCG